MVLETERLVLRPWEGSDAETLYRYASDPAVGPAAGWLPHTSVENSRHIIETVLSAPNTFAVVLRETGEPVGSIGLMPATPERMQQPGTDGEIGYWIAKPYWGRGLIPEAVRALISYAFDTVGLKTLWCGYFDGNEKSRRVQEKCGFRYHHTQKTHWAALERTMTEHFTCLTRQEYASDPER